MKKYHLMQSIASIIMILVSLLDIIVGKYLVNQILSGVAVVAWTLVLIMSIKNYRTSTDKKILVYDFGYFDLPDHLKTSMNTIEVIMKQISTLPFVRDVFYEDRKIIVMTKHEMSSSAIMDLGFLTGTLDSQERTKQMFAKYEKDKEILNPGKN